MSGECAVLVKIVVAQDIQQIVRKRGTRRFGGQSPQRALASQGVFPWDRIEAAAQRLAAERGALATYSTSPVIGTLVVAPPMLSYNAAVCSSREETVMR